MLKSILSTISGKKVPPSVQSQVTPSASTVEVNEKLITVYDAYGRDIKITRSEWHDKVFLPNLQQKWNEAGALYNLIISGLNDGFAADLLPATERLLEIDDMPERGYTIRGIVLMKNGLLDAAEEALRKGITKSGETATLLTNLAKVYAERGNQARADEILWQAVQADPNVDNGLLWWVAIQRERGGEAAYLQALRSVAALPGSWRAKLWLARHHLERKELESARTLYSEVLSDGLYDGSSLMMISGDLGNNGQIPLILELIGPVYDEHKHDPMTGLNLLRACQELGKADEGEALLASMYALNLAPIKQQLDQFAQFFQEIRKQAAQGTPIDPDNLKFNTLVLSQPIWHYGLRNADWLFSQKPENAPKVGFFALSKIMYGIERAESQREDDLGRFTRAIPLYLAEAVHYWSDYATNCYITIVEEGGPVVSGVETDGNALFNIVPPEMKYFVTGEIGSSGKGDTTQWQISLTIWDCSTRAKQASESGKAIQAELGPMVLTLEKRLLTRIGLKRGQAMDAFYQHPSAEVMPAYLIELGQSFMLTLLANEHMSKSALWGERAMLDWPLNMALHWPTVEVPKLMYFSGLGKALDYKSDVLAEYKERSLQLLRETERSNSPVIRLAPLVWKLFDMEEEFHAHTQNQSADVTPAYQAWLRRLSE